jgi:hypothetical protein
MDGGGVHGMDVGTDHVTMIETGFSTIKYQYSMGMSIEVGEDIITIVYGMDTDGIMKKSLIICFVQIGNGGKMSDIGK